MSDETDRMNEVAVNAGRRASGIETTRPLAEPTPTHDIYGHQLSESAMAMIKLANEVALLRKELDEMKQRIRKVC